MYLEQSELYIQAKKEFFESEHLDGSRWFGMLACVIKGPRVQNAAICFHHYIRMLDDRADGLVSPIEAKKILSEEIGAVRSYLEGGIVPPLSQDESSSKDELWSDRRGLLMAGFCAVREDLRKPLAIATIHCLESLYLDTLARQYKRPLSDGNQKVRNEKLLYSNFQMLSLIFFEKHFTKEEDIDKVQPFMKWAIGCDALNDLAEDLGNGLVLFSRDQLKNFGVELKPGEKVPDTMKHLFESEKSALLQNKKIMMQAMSYSTFPIWLRWLFDLYINYKTIKFALSEYSANNVIFAAR